MIQEIICFPSFVYSLREQSFLNNVKIVSEQSLKEQKLQHSMDSIHPVMMSGNYSDDIRIHDFKEFILNTAREMLDHQGYDLNNLKLFFSEMWTQEHQKTSGMEQHIHGFGSQVSGFYFLEVPTESTKVVFYDPRPGKVQINLPEKNIMEPSKASQVINLLPQEGMMLLFNSWLPHSFTRNQSDTPVKFVHFNLSVTGMNEQTEISKNFQTEII